jgi:large subunit ribosomal protein L6
MSRIAKQPVKVPNNVTVNVDEANVVTVKGINGELKKKIHKAVKVNLSHHNMINIIPIDQSKAANMHSGTARALINNMVIGVSQGFERKLQLVGVGYRARSQKKYLNLTLGFSHPINYLLSEKITAETPSQTEIILKSTDKELLGRVAADIRNYRKPEAYKGKGIRYENERVITKEPKKK